MTAHRDNLDPIAPATAQELYLDHKTTSCSDATVQGHRYRTNHFLRWCEQEGIDNLNELRGRDIQRFRLWRKEDGDLNQLSLRMQMSTLRVFLKWAGTIEAVPEDLYNKVDVSRVKPEDRQRDETLDAETAQDILGHLSKYEYGSLEHALIAVLWETGIRLGAVQSLDVGDVNLDDDHLQLVHRPDTGTSLKNGTRGERLVAITPALAEVLTDYLEVGRDDVVDAYGRRPLFTTDNGRSHRNTIRRTVYRVTAPCYRGEACSECTGSRRGRHGSSILRIYGFEIPGSIEILAGG